MKKVTVIGGGTGTYVVLSALKQYDYDLSAIVTMMDSGGSTGKLRDQLGVLPPGDLRQALVALSEAPELWRKLFLYRFENGDLEGHNFGNIFLSAMEKITDNYYEVLDHTQFILRTKGKVHPVTFEKSHLCVEYENGTIIKEEGKIDEDNAETSRIKRAFIEPTVRENPKAIEAIKNSDYIIVGPGDVYTSIVPVLLVNAVREAVKNSKAKLIYIANLMTKLGQTTGYSASDHIHDIQIYAGRQPDIVLLNNQPIPQYIIDWYKDHGDIPVQNDLLHSGFNGQILQATLLDINGHQKSTSDTLTRSILRHKSTKIAEALKPVLV